MKNIINTPLFGIIISILAYDIGLFIYKKTNISFFNPIVTAAGIIISIILLTDVNFEHYDYGGKYISFFLGPATVVLAIPLYRQIKILKTFALPIIAGIITASITAVTSVYLLCKLFGIPKDIMLSLLPKSVTTPIGIELSLQINAIPAITIISIVITGISGAVMAPYICYIFNIKDSVAKGIAIGCASHAVGTSKAVEMGDIEGAMSGLSIGLMGITTVIIVPIFIKYFT